MAAKVQIYDGEFENMVGRWTNSLYLSKTKDGRFTVSFKQTVEEGWPLELPARRGLQTGTEVFNAVRSILDETFVDAIGKI